MRVFLIVPVGSGYWNWAIKADRSANPCLVARRLSLSTDERDRGALILFHACDWLINPLTEVFGWMWLVPLEVPIRFGEAVNHLPEWGKALPQTWIRRGLASDRD